MPFSRSGLALPAAVLTLLALPAVAPAAPDWSAPVRVTDGQLQSARTAMAPDGGVLAVGTRTAYATEASALAGAYRPTGGAWTTTTIAPGSAEAGITRADAAFAADGRATVAWVQETDPHTVWAAPWTPAGGTGTPVLLHTAADLPDGPNYVYDLELTVRADGTQLVTFSDAEGVWAAARDAAGSWGAARQLADDPRAQDPAAAAGDDGTAVVAWTRYTDADGNGNAEHARIEAATFPAGQTAPAAPTAVTPAVDGTFDREPAVGLAGGRAVVTFVRGDFEASRVLAVTRAADGTAGDPVVLSTGASAQSPQVAPRADGAATVAWSQRDADGRPQVLSSELAADGSAAGVRRSPAGQRAYMGSLTAGPGGSALLTWQLRGDDGTSALQTLRRLPGATDFEPLRTVTAPELSNPGTAALGADGRAVQLGEGEWAGGFAPVSAIDLAAADAPPAPPVEDVRPHEAHEDRTPPAHGPVCDTAGAGVAPHCMPAQQLADPTAAGRFRVTRRGTLVRRVVVRGLAAGDVVRVRCAGGGCPKGTRSAKPASGTGATRTVKRPFGGRRLRPGARLVVTVTRGETTVGTFRYAMRVRKAPKRVR